MSKHRDDNEQGAELNIARLGPRISEESCQLRSRQRPSEMISPGGLRQLDVYDVCFDLQNTARLNIFFCSRNMHAHVVGPDDLMACKSHSDRDISRGNEARVAKDSLKMQSTTANL
jgi:hypothetical protein